jgi:hypothetical protein
MGGQEVVERPLPDPRSDRRRVFRIGIRERVRHGAVRPAPVFLPANSQAGACEERVHLGERREPDRVGAGHARPLRLGQGRALFECEREASARRERTRDCFHQRLLVTEGEHRLEQQHDIERARGERWDLRDHEPASKAGGALTRDGDGACTCVYANVAAAELASQEPSGAGDSATQVEYGDTGVDGRLSREGQDLGRAYEALLLDVLAGAKRRLLGSP